MRLIALLAVLAGCQSPPATVAAPFPAEVTCGADRPVAGDIRMPRNLVLVMGDGMGPVQLQAGRIAHGGALRMDGLAGPVYINTDSLTTDTTPGGPATDSAASATAFATGVRVANGAISMDAAGAELTTVAELARDAGKALGLVTTSFVYDASPAAFVAHVAARGQYGSIVLQTLTQARPEVLLGGGRPFFESIDGQYLAVAEAQGYQVVMTADELAAWQPDDRPLLGLFQSSTTEPGGFFTTPVLLRAATDTDPPLPVMAGRALDRLIGDPDGFLLFVENEHPDTLGHIAGGELAAADVPYEVVALDDALGIVLDRLADAGLADDTLVLVFSDHETGGYTLAGDELRDGVFWTTAHTRTPVAVYGGGPGSEQLDQLCRISDLFLLMTGRLGGP